MNAINASALAHAGLYEKVTSGKFLDDLRTAIILFDADGIAIDCNPAATELLSAAPATILAATRGNTASALVGLLVSSFRTTHFTHWAPRVRSVSPALARHLMGEGALRLA